MLSFKSHIIKVSLVTSSATLIALMPLGITLAANLSGGPGQPNVECEDAGASPGQAESAPGSAFNPDGKAGTVYAGEQEQNSVNPHSVSQYDIACFKVP